MTRRCYCGRSVSWDGHFCSEHDDGPDPHAAAMQRHPAGKGLTELPQTADIYDYLRLKGEL